MNEILHNFLSSHLFDASSALLEHLQIQFTPQVREALSFDELYAGAASGPMPKALAGIADRVENTFFIGTIDEETLQGHRNIFNLEDRRTEIQEGKYQGMMIFAVDMIPGFTPSRSQIATLTRGFNRIAQALPVILFIRAGGKLTLATCERLEYSQAWRTGEKLGKVSMLRNIDLESPHRGHVGILNSLGDKAYDTYDKLYSHWLEVFSSEVLTKQFYKELSEWYAWVISSGKVKFPNDITTTEDDQKFNHEAVIRLITRLIFVWFLKRKHLIPDALFDEDAIRDNFIDNFDPHSDNTLFYDPEQSKYYRLILQNLFFAMLNRPIKDEESGQDENRRFRKEGNFQGKNEDYNINNLMRYRKEFREGGAEKLLQLANSQTPFLSGGLFECLDDKPSKMYYDGFSEHPASLAQLSFPDYFFFGEEVGKGVDLSSWYGSATEPSNVRGIINILRSYNFTVEENTPLDQEVSLDPELLGKAFENLLASYNPETGTTARKQTGSFYTPRDIVQYMVDESLIAHLQRTCPDVDEATLRDLFSYSSDTFDQPLSVRRNLIQALYNCKVLDPACGSGAFPMGILQQMVHVLRKLDPTNEIWRDFILEISLAKDREAYKNEDPEERAKLRADIEESFNRNVNDPDYARKLYLIENCIYGVDIQPIAVQISKLRFFISLVAEQNPTSDPATNFGIRPLPNLEAKFVAANSLHELKKTVDLFSSSEGLLQIKKQLADANHKLFATRRNREKQNLRNRIAIIREDYAIELKQLGIVDSDGAAMLGRWDMFNQNSSADFFDSEWMFDITKGFDIVIGNPPYVEVVSSDEFDSYETYSCYELYAHFFERACKLLVPGGILSFITGSLYIKGMKFESLRQYLRKNTQLLLFRNEGDKVFEAVGMPTSTIVLSKNSWDGVWPFDGNNFILRLTKDFPSLGKLTNVQRGLEIGKKALTDDGTIKILTGTNVKKYIPKNYSLISQDTLANNAKDSEFYIGQRLTIRETGSELTATYLSSPIYVNRSLYTFIRKSDSPSILFLVGCLNSKLLQYFYVEKFKAPTELFPKIRIGQAKQLPIAIPTEEQENKVTRIVREIINKATLGESYDELERTLNIQVYQIYSLSYDDILLVDPDTTIIREEYENHE